MWIMMNNSYLSIVSKDCGPAELLVRARRAGDIERVFPDAKVTRNTNSDSAHSDPCRAFLYEPRAGVTRPCSRDLVEGGGGPSNAPRSARRNPPAQEINF
jgi:hypothetical protein